MYTTQKLSTCFWNFYKVNISIKLKFSEHSKCQILFFFFDFRPNVKNGFYKNIVYANFNTTQNLSSCLILLKVNIGWRTIKQKHTFETFHLTSSGLHVWNELYIIYWVMISSLIKFCSYLRCYFKTIYYSLYTQWWKLEWCISQ